MNNEKGCYVAGLSGAGACFALCTIQVLLSGVACGACEPLGNQWPLLPSLGSRLSSQSSQAV